MERKKDDDGWNKRRDHERSLPMYAPEFSFRLSSVAYAKHGRMAVNIPLENCNMGGPDSSTNSRIQSMAVS